MTTAGEGEDIKRERDEQRKWRRERRRKDKSRKLHKAERMRGKPLRQGMRWKIWQDKRVERATFEQRNSCHAGMHSTLYAVKNSNAEKKGCQTKKRLRDSWAAHSNLISVKLIIWLSRICGHTVVQHMSSMGSEIILADVCHRTAFSTYTFVDEELVPVYSQRQRL